MSTSRVHGWMKKTAYIFNVYLNDHDQWDWKGVSTVDFWIPVRSRWTSYADFETFFHSVEPAFNKNSHYRISALPESLVGCEPLLACCQVLPLTFIKAKRWYLYEQPPQNDPSSGPPNHSTQIASLQTAVDQLTELTRLLLQLEKPSAKVQHTETQTRAEPETRDNLVETETRDNLAELETLSFDNDSHLFEPEVFSSPLRVSSPQDSDDSDGSDDDIITVAVHVSSSDAVTLDFFNAREDLFSDSFSHPPSPLSPSSFDSESSEWLYLSGED